MLNCLSNEHFLLRSLESYCSLLSISVCGQADISSARTFRSSIHAFNSVEIVLTSPSSVESDIFSPSCSSRPSNDAKR